MSVFITTAESVKALTVARSLGRKGISITAGSSSRNPITFSSRYVTRHIIYPSAILNPNDYVRNLQRFLSHHKHEVLIPVHSSDTLELARNAHKFVNIIRFPFHRIQEMELINDKAFLSVLAQNLEIPTPKTWIPDKLDNINRIANEIDYPAVIKLRNKTSSLGMSIVRSGEELYGSYVNTINRYHLSPHEYPIIQEYIAGTGFGVSLLFNHGDLRARFTHKRIREYPISGGPSTCRISTKNRLMEEYATRLLKHFSWHGLAHVEFILTKKNQPFLLEVNPRFWGSINQAVQSGVDFPYLLYLMAVDGDIRPVMSYREGVVTRNSFLDFCAYMQGWIQNESKFSHNPCFQWPFYDDIITWDDPAPVFSAIRFGLHKVMNTG